jgi:ATP-binding cassette, subfamily C (CFTR/MRP), member 4
MRVSACTRARPTVLTASAHAHVQAIAAVQGKLLRLSGTCLVALSSGNVVNLVSNDVRRFDDFGPFWVFVCAGPLETAAVLLMIGLEVGALAAFCGVGALLALVPLQAGLAGTIAGLRTRAAGHTDERVRVTGAPPPPCALPMALRTTLHPSAS